MDPQMNENPGEGHSLRSEGSLPPEASSKAEQQQQQQTQAGQPPQLQMGMAQQFHPYYPLPYAHMSYSGYGYPYPPSAQPYQPEGQQQDQAKGQQGMPQQSQQDNPRQHTLHPHQPYQQHGIPQYPYGYMPPTFNPHFAGAPMQAGSHESAPDPGYLALPQNERQDSIPRPQFPRAQPYGTYPMAPMIGGPFQPAAAHPFGNRADAQEEETPRPDLPAGASPHPNEAGTPAQQYHHDTYPPPPTSQASANPYPAIPRVPSFTLPGPTPSSTAAWGQAESLTPKPKATPAAPVPKGRKAKAAAPAPLDDEDDDDDDDPTTPTEACQPRARRSVRFILWKAPEERAPPASYSPQPQPSPQAPPPAEPWKMQMVPPAPYGGGASSDSMYACSLETERLHRRKVEMGKTKNVHEVRHTRDCVACQVTAEKERKAKKKNGKRRAPRSSGPACDRLWPCGRCLGKDARWSECKYSSLVDEPEDTEEEKAEQGEPAGESESAGEENPRCFPYGVMRQATLTAFAASTKGDAGGCEDIKGAETRLNEDSRSDAQIPSASALYSQNAIRPDTPSSLQFITIERRPMTEPHPQPGTSAVDPALQDWNATTQPHPANNTAPTASTSILKPVPAAPVQQSDPSRPTLTAEQMQYLANNPEAARLFMGLPGFGQPETSSLPESTQQLRQTSQAPP
ncbi:hypothetical protein MPH_07022 [Macrophomina phaseolina MS6]|uniref:Uncharacterized protein n=1 Tax=Macrophomina phaseolina (strain MS6) TaxID=1126212 RepID=K2RSA1_MACPH|nr:hypothetical protein MPH_07022 [Macrophomina phaseolina MS6]